MRYRIVTEPACQQSPSNRCGALFRVVDQLAQPSILSVPLWRGSITRMRDLAFTL